MFKTIKEAEKYVGGLSVTEKMPCPSYSIPPQECPLGKILRKVKGSVCSACYALGRGRYAFPNVRAALYRRFHALSYPFWVDAMAFIVSKKKLSFFRWHDAGDILGVWHLENIVRVAERCLDCKFWLPTRQTDFVKEFLDNGGVVPPNLTVRLSGTMLNGPPPIGFAQTHGFVVSSVSDEHDRITCPVSKQGGKCLDCRACWDKKVWEVVYKKH